MKTSKKRGYLILSSLLIVLLITNIMTYITNINLQDEIIYTKENSDLILEETIETLTLENISLQEKLLLSSDNTAQEVVLFVEFFLEQLWENSNTQYADIITRITPYCTDTVINILTYDELTGTSIVNETVYGDTLYRSYVSSASSYYTINSETSITVFTLAEINKSVNGKINTNSYMYEIEVEYIDEQWYISDILQDNNYSIIGG